MEGKVWDAHVESHDGEVTYRGGWDRVLMMCLSLKAQEVGKGLEGFR